MKLSSRCANGENSLKYLLDCNKLCHNTVNSFSKKESSLDIIYIERILSYRSVNKLPPHLIYLALTLYCEFADRSPDKILDDQIAIYSNHNTGQVGNSILRLVRTDGCYCIYIYPTEELFLDGRWVLRIRSSEQQDRATDFITMIERTAIPVPLYCYVPFVIQNEIKTIIKMSSDIMQGV